MTNDELARDVGLVGALTVGIGTTLGAGIFVMPSVVAGEFGPMLWVPFALAGALAAVNALLATELSTALPRSGGGYGWVNRVLGPLFGTVAGFANWASTAVVTAFYCLGFGIYLGFFVPLPEGWLFGLTLTPERSGAVLAAFVFVASNYVGVRNGGPGAVVLVGTLLAVLGGFVAATTATVGLEATLAPVLERRPIGSVGDLGRATALVFVSYLGYAKLAAVAGEVRDPARTLPRAILGSLAVVAALYVAIAVVLEATVDWTTVAASDQAIVSVAASLFGAPGLFAVGAAGILATATSATMSISTSARVGYAMGSDGLVGDEIGSLHPRFGTPYRAFQLTGLFVVILVLVGDLVALAVLATSLHLVVAILSGVALLYVRLTVSTYDPPFSAPASTLVAVVAAGGSFALLAAVDETALGLTAAILAVAVGWYLAYGRHRVGDREPVEAFLKRRVDAVQNGPAVGPSVGSADADATAFDEAPGDTVLVPLSNPRTERDLVELGCTVASARDGNVVAINVVQVPTQTPLHHATDRGDVASDRLLEAARDHADPFDVPFEAYTVFSHRSVEEIFDAARRHRADFVVMGWRKSTPFAGRAEPVIDELAHDLPADFLVIDDRGFDPDRILLPTTGTGNDELGAEIARIFVELAGSDVTLLHVVDGEGERGGGERFLEDWAERHGLGDAERIVDPSGDVEGSIARRADEHTLLIVGATERGLLSRLVRRSLALDVVQEVDCSVLLTERARRRSLRERLLR